MAFGKEQKFSKLIVRIAIAGIGVGLLVMLLTISIVSGFQKVIPNKVFGFWGDAQVLPLSYENDVENKSINRDLLLEDAWLQESGLKSVSPFVLKSAVAKTEDAFEGITLKGIDEQYDLTFLEKNLLDGKIPKYNGDSISNEILISKSLASKLILKTGDKLWVYFVQEPPRIRTFNISGVFNTGLEQEYGRPIVIADLQHIQRLNAWDSAQVGGYELRFSEKEKRKADKLEDIRNLSPVEWEIYSLSDLYPQLFVWLELFDLNERVVIIIMLLVAGINIISALLILIMERTAMIGLLKTLGLSSARIRQIFLWYGAYIIGIGMLIGNGLGFTFYQIQERFGLIKLDEQMYYVSQVPLSISVQSVILLNIGTFVACFLILLIPSYFINKISPAKTMRFG